jgi:hypothetical protein
MIQARAATVVRRDGVKVRTCFWCGRLGKLTRDHVIPEALGGDGRFENIVPACWWCQQERCRILCLARDAGKLREAFHQSRDPEEALRLFRGFCRAVRKQERAQAQLMQRVDWWIKTELDRYGESPTAGYDFTLPEDSRCSLSSTWR